ncbi:MAG: cupin domain-containing protein [Nibricoccus sp.]
MKKVNTREMKEEVWEPGTGKFACGDKQISVALGRIPTSTDLNLRHPFDVEICRVPAGKKICPYHSHSAQWEFYHVIAGNGQVRDEAGLHAIEAGDAFIFKPDEPHQIINNSAADLILYVVADNPIGETCYYPDSKKWMVRSPEKQLIRSEPLDYLDGEE